MISKETILPPHIVFFFIICIETYWAFYLWLHCCRALEWWINLYPGCQMFLLDFVTSKKMTHLIMHSKVDLRAPVKHFTVTFMFHHLEMLSRLQTLCAFSSASGHLENTVSFFSKVSLGIFDYCQRDCWKELLKARATIAENHKVFQW